MSGPQTIVLATRNSGKLREIQAVLQYLPVRTEGPGEFRGVAEPAETGETFAENARAKARYYARATGHWCLADDSGLMVDALGGEPGVHSARWAAGECPPGADRGAIDAANNAMLLARLAGVDDERRTARFCCAMALADPRGRIVIEAAGTVDGRIGHEPRGENGFGYDPLFHVPALGCTTAELPPARKNEISHRGKAARRLADQLGKLLESR